MSKQKWINRLQVVQFKCQMHFSNPLHHPISCLEVFPFLHSSVVWGNKKWLPSIKVKKLENFKTKLASLGCKWSSLNAPGTENPLSHLVLKLEDSPIHAISKSAWFFTKVSLDIIFGKDVTKRTERSTTYSQAWKLTSYVFNLTALIQDKKRRIWNLMRP